MCFGAILKFRDKIYTPDHILLNLFRSVFLRMLSAYFAIFLDVKNNLNFVLTKTLQIRINLNYVDIAPGAGDVTGHWYEFQHMDLDGYVKIDWMGWF